MIFPVQLQLGPKKWNHQGTFPVWTEQMLWWWRGAFSSPLAFQRRSYWMILVNPDISDIHLEEKWVTKVDTSQTELFLGLSRYFFVSKTFQNSLLWDPSESTDIWTRPQATSCESSSTTLAGAPLRRAASAVMPVVSITIPGKLCQMLLNVICHTTHCVYIYIHIIYTNYHKPLPHIYIYIIYSITIYARYKIHTYTYTHIYIYDVYIDILQSITTTTDNAVTAVRSCCSAVSTNPLFADSEERHKKHPGKPWGFRRGFSTFLLVSFGKCSLGKTGKPLDHVMSCHVMSLHVM